MCKPFPCRSVLLFRPPRLSSKFEESVVHHRGPLSITGLRRFIRDNMWADTDTTHTVCHTQHMLRSLLLLCSFGLCPHLTKENKDSLRKRDLLTAYYDLDYLRNPKGSNYWRNRWVIQNEWANMFIIKSLNTYLCPNCIQSVEGGV